MIANLFMPGLTVEDVEVADPPPEEMQARGIEDFPGEHDFIRWPERDTETHVAYRLPQEAHDELVAELKRRAKAKAEAEEE